MGANSVLPRSQETCFSVKRRFQFNSDALCTLLVRRTMDMSSAATITVSIISESHPMKRHRYVQIKTTTLWPMLELKHYP